MRELTCDPSVEVIGIAVKSIAENAASNEFRPLLDKHGLTDIKPDVWYPAQQWLSVMNDLAKEMNTTSMYVAIGMKIAENVMLPPEAENATLAQMLEMWNEVYLMQHKGDDIGGFQAEKIDEKSYRMIITTLYPDDLEYGVLYGMVRRLLPKKTPFTVSYEDINNRRDLGDNDHTVLLINWG